VAVGKNELPNEPNFLEMKMCRIALKINYLKQNKLPREFGFVWLRFGVRREMTERRAGRRPVGRHLRPLSRKGSLHSGAACFMFGRGAGNPCHVLAVAGCSTNHGGPGPWGQVRPVSFEERMLKS
jgi:hypothetical protein